MAIRAIRVTMDNVSKLSRKDIVRFALFCAKQVDCKAPDAIACINVVERWLDNKATSDECRTAAYAAVGAAYASASAAANANAANAASAAYYAVYAANDAYVAAREAAARAANDAANDAAYAAYSTDAQVAQEQYLYELLHIDDIIEQTLLTSN
jgi:hypothetical protein